MSHPPARADVVHLTATDELVSAVPHLLGFHPSDSIVAIALHGPRGRVRFTMRVDLPEPRDDVRVAREVAQRMTHASADAVLLAVYRDQPHPPGALPRDDLVSHVARLLPVPLVDALLVVGDRYWSYLCADPVCCPDEGREVRPDSPGATAMAAASALQGDVVLADRAALVATVQPVTGAAAAAMRAAMMRAAGHAVDPELALRRIDRLCARYSDPPVVLRNGDAARVAVAVHHIAVRDPLLQRLAEGDELLAQLVRAVARLAQPPDDAPISAMLAAVAYLRGDGVVTAAAVDRALDSDPDYSLAHLLAHCLHRQVEPSVLREAWQGDLP